MTLDRRINAWRDDLADIRLRGIVTAPRYVAGRRARIVAGLAPVRRHPASEAEIVTFGHYGEDIEVFDEGAGYAWCQSRFDGYVGYLAADHIASGTTPAPTHFVTALGAYAYGEPDLRTPARAFLPRHGAVVVTDSAIVTRGTGYARLDSGICLPLACLSPQPPRSADLVEAASLYLGCPYLWGGRSGLGIDCSGLVQAAFRDLGVTVARDTDLQRDEIGERVAVEGEAELRRGDLLYLPDHVLIYVGDGMVIHADGANMIVRRDRLDAWLSARGLRLANLIVRRHALAGG